MPGYVVATFRLIALRPSLLRELAGMMGVAFVEKMPSKAGRPRAATTGLDARKVGLDQEKARRTEPVASPAKVRAAAKGATRARRVV